MLQAPPKPTGWFAPVLSMVLLQFIGSFTLLFMPTIAPAMAAEFGWEKSTIGYLSALTMGGSMMFLLAVSPLVHRAGPIRSIQMGLLFCALAFLLLYIPLWFTPIIGSLLIGFSYGPTVPASSQVLQRFSPAEHRSLIFSIKQGAGALGGVFAGLALPAAAAFGGWRAAVLLAMLMVLVIAAMVQPLRNRTDDQRDRSRRLSPGVFLSPENLTRTIRALQSVPGLFSYACAGGLLGLTQGCWNAFLVTFLVNHLGYGLDLAGAVFAIMQIATFIGRLFMGWLSDRLGSGVPIMRISSIGSFLVTGLLALSGPDWPFWVIALISFASGVLVSGWNGVNLAEATLRVPVHLVGEASAGSIVVVTSGHVIGPMAFALLLYSIDRFDIALFIAGAVSLLAWPLIGPVDRSRIEARAKR